MYNVKMLKLIERAWMIIGCVGILGFIYVSFSGNTTGGKQKDQLYFIAFTLIAGLMFAIRRRQRKYAEKVNPPNKPK